MAQDILVFDDKGYEKYPLMLLDIPSNLDISRYRERLNTIIRLTIEFEATSVGIEPTEEAIVNFMLSTVKEPSKELLELKRYQWVESPFIQYLLYAHRGELAHSISLEEFKTLMRESSLKHFSKLSHVSGNFLLPTNNFDIKGYLKQTRPNLLLSVQLPHKVKEANTFGMFKGRMGFTGDGCNELFKNRPDGYVIIARYSKLSTIAPLSRISELGFASDEREWMSCTGIPYEFIDLILPVELFPAALPPIVEADLDARNPTIIQREIFIGRYNEVLGLRVLDQYALSLEYNYEKTGKYLTDAQRLQIEEGNFNPSEFWSKGLKQLREF